MRHEGLEGPAIGREGPGMETIGGGKTWEVLREGISLECSGSRKEAGETQTSKRGGKWTWVMLGLQSSRQDTWILLHVR